MGWYENGCACGERHALMQNYEGDVRKLHDYGFDGVKLDGCGGALRVWDHGTATTALVCFERLRSLVMLTSCVRNPPCVQRSAT